MFVLRLPSEDKLFLSMLNLFIKLMLAIVKIGTKKMSSCSPMTFSLRIMTRIQINMSETGLRNFFDLAKSLKLSNKRCFATITPIPKHTA